jgi:hypothetical protein
VPEVGIRPSLAQIPSIHPPTHPYETRSCREYITERQVEDKRSDWLVKQE